MNALSVASRAKLAKVLAALGADNPTERATAAAAAHRIIREAGLTWRKVLTPPPVERALPLHGRWRRTAAELLARPDALRPWERLFVADLAGFRRLSTKQRYCLTEIAQRVLGERP